MKDLLKSIEKSVRQAGEILLSAHITLSIRGNGRDIR